MERINDQIYKLLMKVYSRYANHFLPSWYVLGFDISAIFFAFFVAYGIRLNLQLSLYRVDVVAVYAVLATFVYAFFIILYRSYIGVIRHTGFHEITRVFKATGSAFAVLLLTALIFDLKWFGIDFSGRYNTLVIHFLLSFFVLTGSRIAIRHVFNRLAKSSSRIKRRFIIFGAGSAGVATCGALLQDAQIDYQVVAFVDDSPSKTGKMLNGAPVVLPAEALTQKFIERTCVDMFIIAVQNLGVNRRRELLEEGLKLHLEMRVMPPVRDWVNGRLSAAQLRRVRIEELLERLPISLGVEHVARDIEGKVVLITGAAGSIGSELARQVVTYKPAMVILFDQAESALYDLQSEINHSPDLKTKAYLAKFEVGNVRDHQRIERLFDTFKPDLVYHAAAYKHVPLMEENPYEAVCVNVMGTRIVADMATKYRAKKFVMISTDKAVNPTNVMGATKRLAEIYVQSIVSASTQFITTRFGNVLDSNGSVIPLFRKQIEKGGPLTITHPEITRYFMMIPEACSLVLEAGTLGHDNEVFVFDMGEPVKIIDLARRMIQLAGLSPGKDIEIQEIGLRPGEKLYEELLCSSENTLSTHHPKIMRVKVTSYNHSEILRHLKTLEKTLETCNNLELVAKLKQMVPEYISNNSVYEALDVKQNPATSQH